ncbi:hypothetical protein THRCLA_07567 [Thraustotheca clavata]|uniref:BZIP domain-containing protein n=1 Tax=Thraustotheca clavata TaxID=74557 RepID=A0A1V9ZCR6_9STRA|nr:hypothetical protein THRCLA_07567 [Thraustotheca clavata]
MAFSFPSRSLDDMDMLFNIEPVPFFELDMNEDMEMEHGRPLPPPQSNFMYGDINGAAGAFVNPVYYDSMKLEMPSAPMLYPKKESSPYSRSPPSGGRNLSLSSINSRCQTEEELLAQPVSSLTEEEKKIRRRAQVAKSARKHRKGLKEELEMLRQQVKYLQEQMVAKVTAPETPAPADGAVSEAVADAMNTRVLHPYTHIPANPEERKVALIKIADQSMARAWNLVNAERSQAFPYFDMKLNSSGPDMEIRLVRGKIIEQFDHKTIVDATWNSVLDFSFDVDARLKRYVSAKKLMNLDADTRYGRIKIPILKTSKGVICMESFFIVRRKIYDNHAILLWKTVDSDELFPTDSQYLRNVELGCAVLETQNLPNGEKQTIMRCVVHSMPPVKAIAEPKGRISEAFLSTLCRCSDFFDDCTRDTLLSSRNKLPAHDH